MKSDEEIREFLQRATEAGHGPEIERVRAAVRQHMPGPDEDRKVLAVMQAIAEERRRKAADERYNLADDPMIDADDPMIDDREDPMGEIDFADYDAMDAASLADALWCGAFGVGDDGQARPADRRDARWQRCLEAAEYALSDIWGKMDAPIAAGEPVSPPGDALQAYIVADSYVFHKITRWYGCVGQGINSSDWRWHLEASRKGAMRAVASLFGASAAEDAERRFIEREVERDKRRPAAEVAATEEAPIEWLREHGYPGTDKKGDDPSSVPVKDDGL
jgi:hypothetical protein